MPAPQTVTVSLPHNLGRAEARRRLDASFDKAKQVASGSPFSLAATGYAAGGPADADRVGMTASAMGQTITGHVDVFDDHVEVSVTLPYLLAKIAQTFKPRLEAETRKALELPEK